MLVPIESAYATSYSSIIVTLVTYHAPFQRFCTFFVLLTQPLFHPNFGGVPVDQLAHVGVSKRIGLQLLGR